MANYDANSNTYILSPDEQDFSIPTNAYIGSGIQGNELANILTGDNYSNIIFGGGGEGKDTLIGAEGNDQYYVYTSGTVVIEKPGEGRDNIVTPFDIDLNNYQNVEDALIFGLAVMATGNDADNQLFGSLLDNKLYGGKGNDELDGYVGADTMVGGEGNDTYHVDSQSDVIVEQAGEGTDMVLSSIAFSLVGTQLEQLWLVGTNQIDGTGNDGANRLLGNDAANHLDGGKGNDVIVGSMDDTLIGGDGDDIFQVGTDETHVTITELNGGGTDRVQASTSFSLANIANVEYLELTGQQAIDGTGNDLDNWIHGSDAANHLDGGNGNDTLVGGLGDTLIGGSGDDTFVVDTDEAHVTITELSGGGTDTVQASVSFSLANIANVENLTLSIFANGRIDGTGNDLNNQITGNQSSNQLDGGKGNDTLIGGFDDTLIGGDGDDTFVVDTGNTHVTITELENGGTDTVRASKDFDLAGFSNVENLILEGTANFGAGNSLANHIIGNDEQNFLDGREGADTLEGGKGSDIYTIDTSDTILESADAGGVDTVRITDAYHAASYVLEDNVENVVVEIATAFTVTGNGLNNVITGNDGADTLSGGDGNDNLTGGSGSDRLDGGNGEDTLGGGFGADVMIGGADNDTYLVGSTDDVVVEDAAGGTFDRVISTVSYTLSGNVEYLALSNAGGNINGTGNDLDNTIFGNDGNNVLDGGAGRDELYGATGADTIYGGDGNDSIHEAGADNDVLYGGGGDDSLEGEGGNDLLDGGSGADHMTGGAGNDTYVVDSTLDTVTETGGGFDTVQASASFALSGDAEVEALIATGSGAIALTGNEHDNMVTGNEAANMLSGQGGNDSLIGNAGNDALSGDGGNDFVAGGDGSDLMQGGLGNDTLSGDTGNDQLYGGDGNDTGLGGIGNDTLKGDNGLDNLKGDAGNDRLWGGLGKDVSTGGAGKDVFVFDTKPNSKTNLDKIMDFSVKDDSFWLDNKVFKKLGKGTASHPGKLNAKFFTVGNHAKDKNDYLIYDNKKGVLYYDDDGSGHHKAVAIATLKKGLKMTYHDFFVI